MGTHKLIMRALAVGLMVSLSMGTLFAQRRPGGDRPGGDRPGGDRPGFDPARIQERQLDQIKERLQVTDDEWLIVRPRLESVMTLNRDLAARGMMGRRRPGGDDGDTPLPTAPVARALEELRRTLADENATANQIRTRLTALREAREKAKADLAQAQEALREVITQRQEGFLVLQGVLD